MSFKQEMKRLYPGHCEACFKLLLALSETRLIRLFREQIRYFINCLLSGEKITDVILCFFIVISDKTSCLNCYFREEWNKIVFALRNIFQTRWDNTWQCLFFTVNFRKSKLNIHDQLVWITEERAKMFHLVSRTKVKYILFACF